MNRLSKRIGALEAVRGDIDYSHLSDAELNARLVAVCEEIEGQDGPIIPNWRELLERGDFRTLCADALA